MANNFPTVGDLVADAFNLSGIEIRAALGGAPLVRRMPVVPSSDGPTHRYIGNTYPANAGIRGENLGRDFDHGATAMAAALLSIVDCSFATDKAVADAWRDGGVLGYAKHEAPRHLLSSAYLIESQILANSNPIGFTGFPGVWAYSTLASNQVVNAGGTTPNAGSSVWLLRLGVEEGVALTQHGKLIELGEPVLRNYVTADGTNKPVYYVPASSWFGLQIVGDECVSRIVNLTEDSGKGLTDDLLEEAYSRHAPEYRPNVVVMTRRSQKQLQQSRLPTNLKGQSGALPDNWNGLPIAVTENLSDTETLLA